MNEIISMPCQAVSFTESEPSTLGIITSVPELYGSGHLRRMHLLSNALLQKGLKVVFILKAPTGWYAIGGQGEKVLAQTPTESPGMALPELFPDFFSTNESGVLPIAMEFHSYKNPGTGNGITIPVRNGQLVLKIGILDLRDDPIPEFITAKKWIAIDNLGPARQKCDIIWDVLPLCEHSYPEFLQTLQRVLIPPEISILPNASNSAVVTLISQPPKTVPTTALFLQTTDRRNSLSPEAFQTKLKKSTCVYCYYGQTLFESMYLGKRIFLYPVSDYHNKLNHALMRNLSLTPKVSHHLDGKGPDRLVDCIYNLFNG